MGMSSPPLSPPELSLEEARQLTPDHVKELTEEVRKLAEERVGEVGGVSGWGQKCRSLVAVESNQHLSQF